MAMQINILEQDDARCTEPLVALACEVFHPFDPAYIEDRLSHIADPFLVLAEDEHGWAGFKLGYRRGSAFYSWLGGVHPRARRRGLGERLMRIQHEHVRKSGYQCVTTRTRATNRGMLILNLKCGFEIVGFETDQAGFAVVSQRKSLL